MFLRLIQGLIAVLWAFMLFALLMGALGTVVYAVLTGSFVPIILLLVGVGTFYELATAKLEQSLRDK